ncbi:DUF4231 family protein [[Mycoplasma] cavipharyngis]|uniref:DUF4231 domain-containing protein n=1 Tax=[Mycoplasma] cavipharyngis TaxID=92757 RepID=UPI003704448E
MLNNLIIKSVEEDFESFVEKYYLKFKLKAKIYRFLYWFASIATLVTTLIITLITSLISAQILKQSNDFALIVLIVSAISSFLSSFLSFFVMQKRYLKNAALMEFIKLERIIFNNKIGIYQNCDNHHLLFIQRLFKKLGMSVISLNQSGKIWTNEK